MSVLLEYLCTCGHAGGSSVTCKIPGHENGGLFKNVMNYFSLVFR